MEFLDLVNAGGSRITTSNFSPFSVDIISLLPGGAELAITIHEGRNRQVRKMCAAVGLRVTKLRRVREGSVELGDLPAGKWRSLTAEEIASFDR